jgi:hypothetical protein
MPESKGEKKPKRKCVLCLTHYLSKPNSDNEVEVSMEFKKEEDSDFLKWKKAGYKQLLNSIRESITIDEAEFESSFPVNGWIKEESDCDGSYGMNYKMEWRDSTPGSLYISLGYTYYSK